MPYIKTIKANALVSDSRGRLSVRDRQIIVLCNGVRPTERMIEFFGPSVIEDLKRLEALGLLRSVDFIAALNGASARRTPPSPPAGAPPAAARPPTPKAAVVADVAAQAFWLRAVHGAAMSVLRQLRADAPEADDVINDYRDATKPEDILILVVQTIRLTLLMRGQRTASKVATSLGYLMPDEMMPTLLDCLVDGSPAELVGYVYAKLLADSETSVPPDAAH